MTFYFLNILIILEDQCQLFSAIVACKYFKCEEKVSSERAVSNFYIFFFCDQKRALENFSHT